MRNNDVVSGFFPDAATANRAVADLGREGYSYDEISVITAADAPGATWSAESAGLEPNGHADDTTEGVISGAAVGGVIGILAGIAALAVPGVGPLFVAGPLASVLTSTAAGATAGGAAGGLAGALQDSGVNERDAAHYEQGLRDGGVVVAVHTDREAQARRVLEAAGALSTREEVRS